MTRARSVSVLALVSLLMLALSVTTASASTGSAISLSRSHLPNSGGTVIVRLHTVNAGACRLTISPEMSFPPISDCAAGGTVRVVLSVPTNPDTSIKRYRLRFTSTDELYSRSTDRRQSIQHTSDDHSHIRRRWIFGTSHRHLRPVHLVRFPSLLDGSEVLQWGSRCVGFHRQ